MTENIIVERIFSHMVNASKETRNAIDKLSNRKLILAHKLRSTDFFSLDLPTLENLFKLLPEK